MHTNTGRQTRQKLREPLQRAQRLYLFYLTTIINKNCTPLIIGDMNATTSAHDRKSTNNYITDKMYQDFIKDHNLSPLPHHSPVDTNLPEPRPWTFSRPMGKDSVGNTTYSYSHIDNILLPTALANTCKSSYTCDLGYLSDHVPLLAVVPTCGSLTL
jgi:exonuclease III